MEPRWALLQPALYRSAVTQQHQSNEFTAV